MSSADVAKVEHHDRTVASWRTADLVMNFMVYTSLPTAEESHRIAILRIIESDATPGSELIGEEFWIGEFIVHAVPLVDGETGEEYLGRRIVLPQPDGRPVAFVSEGVIKSLERISWAVGSQPPWDPPVRVRLKQLALKGGKRYFKLCLVKE